MYGVIYADDELEENLEEKELSEVINVASKSIAEPIINSRIGIIYDRKSGKVIWGKNENKRSAMASTTKIMTCIVVIENADLNAEVKVSAKAAGTGGSRLGLKKDDKITIVSFKGEKNYTIVYQELSDSLLTTSRVYDEFVLLDDSLGFTSTSSLTFYKNNYEFKIVSNTLTLEEMVEVANSIQID